MMSRELKPEISLLMIKKCLCHQKFLSYLSLVYYLEITFQNGEKREQYKYAYTAGIWLKVALKAVRMKVNYGALNVLLL